MEEKNTNATKHRNPVTWVPSVYFAMGLPFVVLNMVTVLMFKGLDISDAQIALWTCTGNCSGPEIFLMNVGVEITEFWLN